MEADYDLYGDLEDPFFPVEKESSTNEITTPHSSVSISSEELDALKEQNSTLSEQNAALKKNISCLFKTARLEIDRKDAAVRELEKSIKELQYFLVMKSLADGVGSNSFLKEDFGNKEGAGEKSSHDVQYELLNNIGNSKTRNGKLCVSSTSTPSSKNSSDFKKKLDSSSRKSSDHGSSSSPPDTTPVSSSSTRSGCSRNSEDNYSREGHKVADGRESLDLRHKIRSTRKPISDSHHHKSEASERKPSRSHSRHHESSSSRHHEPPSSSRHHRSSSSRHHELSSSYRHHKSSSRYHRSSRSQEASKLHHREKRPRSSRHRSTSKRYHDDSREHIRVKSGSESREIWDTISEVSGCTLGSLDDVCAHVDLDFDELVDTQIGPPASVDGSPAGKYLEVDLHQESPLPHNESGNSLHSRSSPPLEKAQPSQSVPSPSDSCTSPHSPLSQTSISPHIVHSPTSLLESSKLVTSRPSSEPYNLPCNSPFDLPIDILSLAQEPMSPSVSSDSYSHCEVVTLASSLESHCDDDCMTFNPTLDENWLNSLQISSSFDNPNHLNQNASITESNFSVATKSSPSASPHGVSGANPGTPKSSTPEPELGTPDTLVFEASDFPELDSSGTSKCDVSDTPWFNVSDIPELCTFAGSLKVNADVDEVTVSGNTPLGKCIVDTVSSGVIKKNVIRGIPHKTMKENVAPKIEHTEPSAQEDKEKQKAVLISEEDKNVKSPLKEEEVEEGEITESSEDEKVSNDDTSFVCLDDLTNHPEIMENNDTIPKRRRRSHSRSRLSASSRRNDTAHSRHTPRSERHSSTPKSRAMRSRDLDEKRKYSHRSRSPRSAHHHKHSRTSSHHTSHSTRASIS